jgi:predicted amidohydrolase YtcJ
MREWIGRVLLLATAWALSLPARGAPAQAVVLRGAPIYTLDPARPWARALVIRAGLITFVGDEASAHAFAGPDARVITLQGGMVLPGFHDSHVHPMTSGMRLLQCRLGGLQSARQVIDAVRACAAKEPRRAWLLGSGWSPELFPKGALQKLDELVPDRPAFITNEDGITAWVNSRALEIAGIADRSGVVSGDTADLVRRHVPIPSQAEYREALRLTTAMANAAGITSLVDANASPAVVEAYRAADLAGELTVRVVADQRVDPRRGAQQVEEMVARRDRVRGRRFRADGAKIFVDGDIDQHTAALLQPYADAPASRGELLIEPAALDGIVRRLDAEGFLVQMHAMGDRAVRAGLDAIERARLANGPCDRRHQLAHVGVVDPLDLPRFGRLGVTADFQPIWAQARDPADAPARAALGPERARFMYPMASVAAGGARIVAGSDWPSLPMSPWEAIQVAMTRQPLDGSAPARQPQERVGLALMLAAYTREAAWIAREEAIDGSIQVGKAADLVVLDRNLFEVPVKEIHRVRVLLTLLDGEPVYGSP